MNDLKSYGANARRFEQAAGYPGLYLARVLSRHRDLYTVATERGECLARVCGRFRHAAARASDYPAVGDFVMADRATDADGGAMLHAVLPRKSMFERRAADSAETQALAANIDYVFLCMSLNENYNLNRLERYLSVAWSSGAAPVVLLTKTDLRADLPRTLAEVAAVAGSAPVVSTSRENAANVRAALLPYLGPGVTASFIGSSGVGKSTLINLLSGQARMETAEIRRDGKGRHTTTARELLLLPNGGLVIDTPGMRELGAQAVDLASSFADIAALAAACRFSDCTHTAEPGCAVQRALADGALSARRLESYKKLGREARYDGLSFKEREGKRLNDMFGDKGGMKKIRKHIRENDKRR